MYCVEGYLIYKYNCYRDCIDREKIFKKNTGKDWDPRNKYQVYKDLKKILGLDAKKSMKI